MTLEEVKEISMRDTLMRYGIQPNRAGFIRCPFHNDKGPSMKIYQKSAHCFGCGWTGDQIDFVAKFNNLSFKEAFMELGGTYDHEDKEEVKRKIKAAEQRRREREAREAVRKARIDRNNRYISLLRNGIEHFPVWSDEWCYCQTKLPYQLYLHDILNETRAKNETIGGLR